MSLSALKVMGVFGVALYFMAFSTLGLAQEKATLPTSKDGGQVVFSHKGKQVTVEDLKKEFPNTIFQIEKEAFEKLHQLAGDYYLRKYFEELGKKSKITADQAREKFLKEKGQLSDEELKAAVEQFKDHPNLKGKSKNEMKEVVGQSLKNQKESQALAQVFHEAMGKGELEFLWPLPQEAIYDVPVTADDKHVRYGPGYDDIKPMGCEGDQCPITVVEYSEFQCPYCARVLPTVKRLLEEYKGKIRWVVRDLPLEFHDRAIPAAIAAGCAGEQNKFWHMYHKLFENQRNLSDRDFVKYAKDLGIYNSKFKDCQANSDAQNERIQRNMNGARKLEVRGTPAFFINGRRFSGAIPYERFKVAIEYELGLADKKSDKKG